MSADPLRQRVKFDPSKPETFALEKITIYCQLPLCDFTDRLISGELKQEAEEIIRRDLGLQKWNRVELEFVESRVI